MKRSVNIFKLLTLLLVISMLITSCGGSKTTTKPEEKSPDNTLSSDTVIGSYEGAWQMSPNMKPLASLVLLKDNKYEFYISIMGLMEEGTFVVSGKDTIIFTPAASGVSKLEGKYTDGIITAAFTLGMGPASITFSQVSSPDDVYKEFLGNYTTKVMGKMDVTISLLPGKKYENTLSKETGSFKIYNGTITLIPDKPGSTPITGAFDVASKEMKITMSVMEGTPTAEMVFKKAGDEKALIYKGTSTVGMSGSTEVQLFIKAGDKFEIQTTKPRGTGTYKITEEGGKIVITFTYTDPAKRPDGTDFILKGTMKNKDIAAPGNSITIDSIEYIVNMNGTLSVMKLGQVTFEQVSGN